MLPVKYVHKEFDYAGTNEGESPVSESQEK